MANHRRSVEKETYWRVQLERQPASGLSVRRWCRENGVSEPTFYVWRRELRKRGHERGLTDRDSHESFSKAVVASGFVAVDVATLDAVSVGREAKLEIDVAGDIVIRLREDASAETLERVLTVVCRDGVARSSHGEVRSC
jgi:transposase-like protein